MKKLLIQGQSSKALTETISKISGIKIADSRFIQFSDGNLFVEIGEDVADKEVIIVQSIALQPNRAFMELLFWIDASKRSGAAKITAVLPFFSYSKSDKQDGEGTSIRARVCAKALENAGLDHLITMDMHSLQVESSFDIQLTHLLGRKLLSEAVKEAGINATVYSPDVGFLKDARDFARMLKVPVAVGDKYRLAHDENAQVMGILGDVENKDILIVDDFSVSGKTLIHSAIALKEKGAKKIYAAISHALMNEEALVNIEKSPIEKLFVLDTVENEVLTQSSKIIKVSSAKAFAEALVKINIG